ncbi:hypothetical protein BFP97_15765 [Roseivirga sp. 4D4]|uniref:LytR/AlgR family response regulator transcription factor n=1 Tax=Roseivirga sp. 4D4 TaxID=1889784 RepID=UPI000853D1AC|nr:LytTR family DNA-binding domain-containing protein [Roseivirga sp. 4D4]OEK02891.1 hypothetical protein BFP97_15765 [Roseivirga sp. 4D4]
MEFNCIIIEDQLQAQKILQRHIASVPHLTLLSTFNNAIEAMTFLQNSGEKIDVVFLDINLPKLNGLELLRNHQPEAHIIITTAYKEYAIEGFELNVHDYLLKPISFERFFKSISRLQNNKEEISTARKEDYEQSKFIFAKDGHDIIKIYLASIQFVTADGDFTKLYLGNRTLLLGYSLKFWQEVLPNDQFFRCHKSYIVNIAAIDRISGNNILIGKEIIPVGRTSKDMLMKKIKLI